MCKYIKACSHKPIMLIVININVTEQQTYSACGYVLVQTVKYKQLIQTHVKACTVITPKINGRMIDCHV